jgi:AraC-like DNA-binding protein
LDTVGIAPDERLEAVNQAFNTVSMPTQVTRASGGGEMAARMEIWQLGSGVLFTARLSGIRLSRDEARVRRSSPTNLVVSFQASGRASFGQAGRQQAVGQGSLMLVDQRYPYECSWLEPGRSLSYQVNLDELGMRTASLWRAATHLHTSPFFPIFRSHLTQLTAAADQLTGSYAASTAGTVTTELMRALLTTAAGEDPEPVPPEAEISRLFAYARQNLHDRSLCAERIAYAMNISLRHLYTLCRTANISLEQWIIEHRLESARAQLGTPTGQVRTIAATAHACGFTDPAHFSRRFRQTYGVTPRQWQ